MVPGDLKDSPPPPPHPPDKAVTYRIYFLQGARNIACPVGGCPGSATSRSTLWVHFLHHHVRDTVVILDEGSHPLPCCPRCDMSVTWWDLNGKHQATTMYARGEEWKWKWKRRREEEAQRSIEVALQAYRRPFVAVS